MTTWRLDPEGISQVLEETAGHQEKLAEALAEDKFESIFSNLESGAPITNAVPDSVSKLLADQESNLNSIGNRVGAGIVGVYNATYAYQQGQQDMATEFATRMDDAAAGDFSYYEEHGYKGD